MREANFFASLALYGICGIVWLYKGTAKEFWCDFLAMTTTAIKCKQEADCSE